MRSSPQMLPLHTAPIAQLPSPMSRRGKQKSNLHNMHALINATHFIAIKVISGVGNLGRTRKNHPPQTLALNLLATKPSSQHMLNLSSGSCNIWTRVWNRSIVHRPNYSFGPSVGAQHASHTYCALWMSNRQQPKISFSFWIQCQCQSCADA
jgi:hypothetical protein